MKSKDEIFEGKTFQDLTQDVLNYYNVTITKQNVKHRFHRYLRLF